jgi:hypothetical protein
MNNNLCGTNMPSTHMCHYLMSNYHFNVTTNPSYYSLSWMKPQSLPHNWIVSSKLIVLVTTLALSSQPRQGLTKVRAKSEARESHSMLPGVWESVKEWTSTLPSELPFWELESQWIHESSKNICRAQNQLYWNIRYIIRNILEPKCLKWARMTHLGN